MPTHYKLHYFPVRGRGEFIKYILEYANVPYDDIVVKLDLDEWKTKTKQTMPMGVVPVLELEDGRKLSQSLAISRYLAGLHGLLSNDSFENAWGDQLACAIEDIYPPYYRPYVLGVLQKDEEKRKEAWENMKKDGLTPLFTKFEQFLGDKEWFCGKKVHWSDFVIAEFVNRIEEIFEKGWVPSHFPRLYQHCKRVHELPRIKQYVNRRPQYPL